MEAFRRDGLCPLAVWHLLALGAAQIALLLLLLDWRLVWTPLLAFAAVMAIGPFFPRWGLFLPVTTRRPNFGGHDAVSFPQNSVSLTFDDGPHPATTASLLTLLKRHNARATFFVVGRHVQAHPELIHAILADGHEIGNHSGSHDIFLALRSRKRLMEEVLACQAALAPFGIQPLAFRPPVGIVNPMMRSVLLRLGLSCVTFNRRGPDVGNRRLAGLAARILKRIAPGDIVLLHDTPPPALPVEAWLQEVEALLAGVASRNLAVEPLSRFLRRPIMKTDWGIQNKGDRRQNGTGNESPYSVSCILSPVFSFYDSVAQTYDEEQQRPSMSRMRRAEERVILARLPTLVTPEGAVLELGAGTGRFTLPLAKLARRVTAVDASAEMAAMLERKAHTAGAANIRCLVGDFREMAVDGPFDLICAFSCFEYVGDLPALLSRLANCLAPGGRLHFTTAHRSFFRFFAQVGNALRQGLWLRARSRREIAAAVREAGLALVQDTTLFGGPGGRMLIEVVAAKIDKERE